MEMINKYYISLLFRVVLHFPKIKTNKFYIQLLESPKNLLVSIYLYTKLFLLVFIYHL